MDVEIISRECIKPSSPTPSHLKTHKLCLLDQNFPHFYVSVVFYYPLNQSVNLSSTFVDIDQIVSERLQLLKQSLSENLTLFYPLAGKLKDNNISVDCNDEGIYFVEAQAKIPLNEFLSQGQTNLSLIGKLVPKHDNEKSGRMEGQHVAKIQVTTFLCGGLAICICFSHKFGDGSTISLFVKNWCAIARKNTEQVICPDYDASSIFPPNNEFSGATNSVIQWVPFSETGKFVMGRFSFTAKSIANLKAKAASSCVQNPTRIEAVSALLSKCIMATSTKVSGLHKPTLLTHTVNLRRRIKPPISDCSMGNVFWSAKTLCTKEELELDGLARQLREAISKINADFVKSLQGDGGFLNLCKTLQDEGEMLSKAVNRILFSSWCNFGFYNIDFGWGKPILMSPIFPGESAVRYLNLIIFTDTRLEDGIEAWVFLLEEVMALLKIDKELLAFVS